VGFGCVDVSIAEERCQYKQGHQNKSERENLSSLKSHNLLPPFWKEPNPVPLNTICWELAANTGEVKEIVLINLSYFTMQRLRSSREAMKSRL
jgi:hypothetical protein